MTRKSNAAAKAPTTVLERRRALRDKDASGPGLSKAVIDLTKPGARKQLTALYPRPTSETYLVATPALERAALEYIQQRDVAKVASESKEVAGNILCNAIASNRGILGAGWKAEWDMSKGNVDWTQLATDLNISDEVIAKYRKPEVRGLDVKEVASEAT